MNMKVGALGSGQSRERDDRARGQARAAQRRRRAAGRDRAHCARRPGQYTACYPEWEERSPWEPLHVERGFRAEDSVVTGFRSRAGPRLIVDQLSRTAHALAGSLGMALESCWHPKLHGYGEVLLVISPEHADTIKRDGWSKAQVRNRIQEASARPIRELLPDANAGEGMALRYFGLTIRPRSNSSSGSRSSASPRISISSWPAVRPASFRARSVDGSVGRWAR